MKDTHNVILIIVSSKWLIPSFGVRLWYQFLSSMQFIFLSGVPSFLYYLIEKVHLNHRKASPCVFQLLFLLSSFYYRSSSWRLYMVVRQGVFSFFNCYSRFLSKLRSDKLYSKLTWCSTHVLFWGVQVFFILHSKVQLFLQYLLRWCYAILDNLPLCVMVHT